MQCQLSDVPSWKSERITTQLQRWRIEVRYQKEQRLLWLCNLNVGEISAARQITCVNYVEKIQRSICTSIWSSTLIQNQAPLSSWWTTYTGGAWYARLLITQDCILLSAYARSSLCFADLLVSRHWYQHSADSSSEPTSNIFMNNWPILV